VNRQSVGHHSARANKSDFNCVVASTYTVKRTLALADFVAPIVMKKRSTPPGGIAREMGYVFSLVASGSITATNVGSLKSAEYCGGPKNSISNVDADPEAATIVAEQPCARPQLAARRIQ
jgi:hypothetical protein